MCIPAKFVSSEEGTTSLRKRRDEDVADAVASVVPATAVVAEAFDELLSVAGRLSRETSKRIKL